MLSRLLIVLFVAIPITIFSQTKPEIKQTHEEYRNEIRIDELERKQNILKNDLEQRLKEDKEEIKEELTKKIENEIQYSQKVLNLEKENLDWWKWLIGIVIGIFGIWTPWRLSMKIKEVDKTQNEINRTKLEISNTLFEAKQLKTTLDAIISNADKELTAHSEDLIKSITSKYLQEEREGIMKDIRVNSEREKQKLKIELDDYVEKLNSAKDEEDYSAEDWFIKGFNFSEKEMFDEAIDAYTKSIEISPHPFAYSNRGVSFNAKREYDKALDDFNKSIELNQNVYEAFNGRGLTYLHLGKLNEALNDFNKSIEINPSTHHAYINRGVTYQKMGKRKLAKADLDKAFSIDDNDFNGLLSRASYYSTENLKKAFSDINKVLSQDPDNRDAYNFRGTLHVLDGEYDIAIQDYNKAIELGFHKLSGILNIIEAYLFKGDYPLVLTNIEESRKESEINPSQEVMLSFFETVARLFLGEDISDYEKNLDDLISKCDYISWSFDEIENWANNNEDLDKEKLELVRNIVTRMKS